MQDLDIMSRWGKGNDEVNGVDEYIKRVAKINREREYCNKFLVENSALYFAPIGRILLEVVICDVNDNELDRISFEFGDGTVEADFYGSQRVEEILSNYQGDVR